MSASGRSRHLSSSLSMDSYSNGNGDGSFYRRQESVVETMERQRRENISRKLRELRESAPTAQTSVPGVSTNSISVRSMAHMRRRRNLMDNNESLTMGGTGRQPDEDGSVGDWRRPPAPQPVFIPTIVPLHRVASASILQSTASMSTLRTRNGSSGNGNDFGNGPMRADWSIGVPKTTGSTSSFGINRGKIMKTEPEG